MEREEPEKLRRVCEQGRENSETMSEETPAWAGSAPDEQLPQAFSACDGYCAREGTEPCHTEEWSSGLSV